ncbi:hypothetical protein WJX81_000097 [Elliptochloris bilobata]|uniref:Uncharacterized protein n=1 Tax=Elliptochloris bilobata TaxID=381761 RepID=A0AAW1RIE0_9CHLO
MSVVPKGEDELQGRASPTSVGAEDLCSASEMPKVERKRRLFCRLNMAKRGDPDPDSSTPQASQKRARVRRRRGGSTRTAAAPPSATPMAEEPPAALQRFAVPQPTVPGAGSPPMMALPRSSNPPAAGEDAREPSVLRAREAALPCAINWGPGLGPDSPEEPEVLDDVAAHMPPAVIPCNAVYSVSDCSSV